MEQMRERELLPCPFCGGQAELFNWATLNRPLWKVGCRTCDASIDPDQRSIEACHEAWNTRADMQPEIDRRVAEEKAKLLERLREPSEAMNEAGGTRLVELDGIRMSDNDRVAVVWKDMLAQFEKEQQP